MSAPTSASAVIPPSSASPTGGSTPATSPTAPSTPTPIVPSSTPVTTPPAPSSTTPVEPSTSLPPTPTIPTTTPTTAPTPTTTPTTASSVVTPVTTIITTATAPDGSTTTVVLTSFTTAPPASSALPSSTASSDGSIQPGSGASSGGLDNTGKIAVAVVVPVVGVALIVVAALFFWRRRRQRRDAEEERRKEVEDYSYNPNNDPALPDIGGVAGAGAGAGAYELKDDTTSGYRGWGSTTVGSTGRKASTTMSGGVGGAAYSDVSHSRLDPSENYSEGPLINDGSRSPEGEILGAMGPSAAENRSNVHRGPSNASSSYSAAGRSDASGENVPGVAYGNYYDGYGNPYGNNAQGQQGPAEVPGQPVIRDNPARRNTRIENPSHFPQQSAGISQNF